MPKYLCILCLLLIPGCASHNTVDKEQFTISDSTVLHNTTDLMWADSDNNQSLTWQEAVEYCDTFNGSGYDDWRMPTVSELGTLIAAKITKNGEVIHLSTNLIWASETEDSKGAYCNFTSQGCSWMEQVISMSFHALPVRDTTISALDTATPAPAAKPQSTKQRLQMLDLLHKQELITDEEYKHKKSSILDEL